MVQHVLPTPDRLTIVVAQGQNAAACPDCAAPSLRVHSRHERMMADLPWQGRTVTLRVLTRRFRCLNPDCPRATFAERLPEAAAAPLARRTARLADLQRHLGLALGGEAGARLAARLAVPTSADTLLRMARRAVRPAAGSAARPAPPPRVLAVDDWAWRRGHRYGTVLVDLERSRIVDLLPDRRAETLAGWLQANPGVEVVARDRAGAAAERHHAAAKRIGREILAASAAEAHPDAATVQARPSAAARRSEAARARRHARFEEAARLNAAGASLGEISRCLHVDRKTLRRWLRAGGVPAWRQPKRGSALDPHAGYLERRWAEGCRNAARLWRELSAMGFQGRPAMVRAWATRRRCAGPASMGGPSAADGRPWQPPSGRRVGRVLMADVASLCDADRAFAARLLEEVPALAAAVDAARRLALLLRKRSDEDLDDVLAAAAATPLAGFVSELRKDLAAVRAALALPWTTGPAEGHVNRIKLLKRTMYGRAGFGLLRARVLHAA